MSKLIKATKRISAIAASALLLSSASYANVSNYASNFEKNGMFVGEVVVGSGVGADDSAAANVVINDLKSRYSGEEMVELSFSRAGETSGDSVVIDISDDNDAYLLSTLSSIESELDYDNTKVSFLEDGVLSDQENENKDYDFKQSINLGTVAGIDFSRSSSSISELKDRTDIPVPYLNMKGETLYELVVDFDTISQVEKTSEEGQGLVDGEKLKIFGQEFTFDPNTENTDDLKLFTSSQTVILDSSGSSSVTVNHEGKSYEVMLMGANSGSNRVEISINGDRKSVDEGDTATIGGLKVFVDEVFVDDLVEADKDASARLFLGSNEIEIPRAARKESNYKKLIVDGDNLDGYLVNVETSDENSWNGLKKISFRFKPSDLDDGVDYLMDEDYVQDPVFKELSVSFESPEDLKDGDEVEFNGGSEHMSISFTNEDGNDYDLYIYTGDATDNSSKVSLYSEGDYASYASYEADVTAGLDDGLGIYEVLVLEGTTFGEENIFILNEGLDDTTQAGDEETVTQIYQVEGFGYEGDNTYDHYVTILNLMTGDSEDYEVGDELDDTGVTIGTMHINSSSTAEVGDDSDLDIDATYFKLDFTKADGKVTETSSELYTEGNLKITLAAPDSSSGAATVEIDEISFSGRSADLSTDMSVAITSEDSNPGSSDTKLVFSEDTNDAKSDKDADSNWQYGLTKVGTYSEEDTEDNEQLTLWTPEKEIEYSIKFNFGEVSSGMEGSRVVPASKADEEYAKLEEEGFSVTRNSVEASNVEFSVSAPVMDSAASGSNMIVVGGPAVNSQARALLGMSDYSMANAGVSEGEAVVRYFSSKNSVLAYGWSSAGTMAAVRSLVDGSAVDNRKFSE